MKREYGIPVPRGVPKDWTSRQLAEDGDGLRGFGVTEELGAVTKAVSWSDRFGRTRLFVFHFETGRSATVRIDANGNWKTSFGDVE